MCIRDSNIAGAENGDGASLQIQISVGVNAVSLGVQGDSAAGDPDEYGVVGIIEGGLGNAFNLSSALSRRGVDTVVAGRDRYLPAGDGDRGSLNAFIADGDGDDAAGNNHITVGMDTVCLLYKSSLPWL